jgi:hypothetical protein
MHDYTDNNTMPAYTSTTTTTTTTNHAGLVSDLESTPTTDRHGTYFMAQLLAAVRKNGIRTDGPGLSRLVWALRDRQFSLLNELSEVYGRNNLITWIWNCLHLTSSVYDPAWSHATAVDQLDVTDPAHREDVDRFQQELQTLRRDLQTLYTQEVRQCPIEGYHKTMETLCRDVDQIVYNGVPSTPTVWKQLEILLVHTLDASTTLYVDEYVEIRHRIDRLLGRLSVSRSLRDRELLLSQAINHNIDQWYSVFYRPLCVMLARYEHTMVLSKIHAADSFSDTNQVTPTTVTTITKAIAMYSATGPNTGCVPTNRVDPGRLNDEPYIHHRKTVLDHHMRSMLQVVTGKTDHGPWDHQIRAYLKPKLSRNPTTVIGLQTCPTETWCEDTLGNSDTLLCDVWADGIPDFS